MFTVGRPEIFLLFVVGGCIGLLFLWPAWRVIGKTGFPGALALIGLLPFGQLALLIFLAVAEWPIHREVQQLRRGTTP